MLRIILIVVFLTVPSFSYGQKIQDRHRSGGVRFEYVPPSIMFDSNAVKSFKQQDFAPVIPDAQIIRDFLKERCKTVKCREA